MVLKNKNNKVIYIIKEKYAYMSIKIEKIVVGHLRTNSYLVYDEGSKEKEGFLIDPAFNTNEILQVINNSGVKVKFILLTHGHFDHVFMVNEIKELLGCDVLVLINEHGKEVLNDSRQNLMLSFMGKENKIDIDKYLVDGEIIECGNMHIKHIHIGGHTIDSGA